MTLRNFDIEVKDLRGEVLKDDKGVMTLRHLIVTWLGNGPQSPGPQGGYQPEFISGEERIKMYRLGMRLVETGDHDISTDDAAIIKRCVGHLPPLTYAPICDALERDLPGKEDKRD